MDPKREPGDLAEKLGSCDPREPTEEPDNGGSHEVAGKVKEPDPHEMTEECEGRDPHEPVEEA